MEIMMLVALALLLASTQACEDIRKECRICPASGDKSRCSNIGIACQPSIRICRRSNGAIPPDRPKTMKRRNG